MYLMTGFVLENQEIARRATLYPKNAPAATEIAIVIPAAQEPLTPRVNVLLRRTEHTRHYAAA